MAIRMLLMITALLFVGGASGMSHASGKTTTFDFNQGFTAAGLKALSVADGDEIVFTWTGAHNVYLMKDKAAFDACVWDGSTLVGEKSGVKKVISGKAGTVHYFACQVGAHCKSGQKLAVTIGARSSGVVFADATAATASLAVRPAVSSLSALVVALVTLSMLSM